ncbi:MAG: serine/threonine protein kinase [Cuspidothrix sp.]
MDVSPQSYPQPLNPIHYFCINPKCQQPRRPINETFCQSCGSDLFLKKRYRVLNLLNLEQRRDRECTLYNAIDTEHPQKPKVIKVLYTENQAAIYRFQSCARVLIDHWFKGIPHVDKEGYFHIEFPQDPTPAYCLVMEKIEGINLEKWMENRSFKPIDEEKALDWLEQLANILCKLHDKNFYHRDIKPSNIMLRDRINELVLIDLDTGRAIIDASLVGKDITRVGTPGYQAPEQENGAAVPQSDFYALGRTFIYLLTGKRPTDRDLMSKQPGKLNWKAHAQQLQIFGSFASFIDKLMAWDQNDRPRDAQEIVRRLKEIKQRLQLKKQVGKIFSLKPFKASIIFKNVFGVIVMLIVVLFVYKNMEQEQDPSRKKIKSHVPTTTQSPELNPLCKYSEQGKVKVRDEHKLANEVQDFLKKRILVTQDITLKQVKLNRVFQAGCSVTIIILNDQNTFNPNLENQIKQLIKNNFNYVDNIKVMPLEQKEK